MHFPAVYVYTCLCTDLHCCDYSHRSAAGSATITIISIITVIITYFGLCLSLTVLRAHADETHLALRCDPSLISGVLRIIIIIMAVMWIMKMAKLQLVVM